MTSAGKPKVVFLSPVGHFKGGAEKCLQDFLDNPGISPILIAPHEGPILEYGRKLGIPCFVLPFGDIESVRRPFTFAKGVAVMRALLAAAWGLRRIAKANGAHIVHSNGLKAHAINCASRWLGGASAVVHIHDIPYTRQEKAVWNIMCAMCNAMVMVSRPCWPGPHLPRKCLVIHNGIDIPSESPKEKTPPADKDAPVVVGFVGRIHPAKGLHLLLEWLAQARGSGLSLVLSVRGPFSEDAPNYKNEIMEKIAALDLSAHVAFLGHVDDPEKVYAGLDLVVVPSQTPDPLPRSVMEPMAKGLPVMGYPAGGIVEMIEDGKTGYLVTNGQEFVAALNDLRARKAEIVSNAREKIRREFSMSGLYRSLDEVYASCGR